MSSDDISHGSSTGRPASKVSVITAVLEGAGTLEACLASVAAQTHRDVEHIVIDGGSTDGSVEILRRWPGDRVRWISEPDGGLFDAFNKGIAMAGGEIVAIIGSDDLLADPEVVTRAVDALDRHRADLAYGDLVYVSRSDVDRVIRYWRERRVAGRFRLGWAPPHPTCFVRRSVFDRYGVFEPGYRISGDYEWLLRVVHRHRVPTVHVPAVQARMRIGGVSNRSLRSLVVSTAEDLRAWRSNGLGLGIAAVVLKKLRKLGQFARRPRSAVGAGVPPVGMEDA